MKQETYDHAERELTKILAEHKRGRCSMVRSSKDAVWWMLGVVFDCCKAEVANATGQVPVEAEQLKDERQPVTPERLAEIEARAIAATPGPLRYHSNARPGMEASSVTLRVASDMPYPTVAHLEIFNSDVGKPENAPQPEANGRLFANAREDVLALCAEVRRLRRDG